jgi:uncharacterized protein YpmB
MFYTRCYVALIIMNKSTMELYLMIGSSDKIIEYLKSEGIKTKKAAIAVMSGAATSNAIAGISLNTNSGIVNSSHTARRVIDAFED